MKNLRNLILAAIAGAALFTGCKKDDSLVPTAAGATTATSTKPGIPDNGGFIRYKLATVTTKPGDIVAFKSGSINAVSLRLDAVLNTGNPLKMITLTNSVSVNQWQLYQPIDLGGINLQEGRYASFTFSVELISPEKGYALTLDGNYVANSDPNRVPAKTTATAQRPVHIFVADDVMLAGDYSLPLLITNANYYTATLYLSPNDLMQGITPTMLDQATTITDNIYITRDSNPTLYKQIILNLTNKLHVTLEVKDSVPNA